MAIGDDALLAIGDSARAPSCGDSSAVLSDNARAISKNEDALMIPIGGGLLSSSDGAAPIPGDGDPATPDIPVATKPSALWWCKVITPRRPQA